MSLKYYSFVALCFVRIQKKLLRRRGRELARYLSRQEVRKDIRHYKLTTSRNRPPERYETQQRAASNKQHSHHTLSSIGLPSLIKSVLPFVQLNTAPRHLQRKVRRLDMFSCL